MGAPPSQAPAASEGAPGGGGAETAGGAGIDGDNKAKEGEGLAKGTLKRLGALDVSLGASSAVRPPLFVSIPRVSPRQRQEMAIERRLTFNDELREGLTAVGINTQQHY